MSSAKQWLEVELKHTCLYTDAYEMQGMIGLTPVTLAHMILFWKSRVQKQVCTFVQIVS